jgi:epoxyqueuosine reductase
MITKILDRYLQPAGEYIYGFADLRGLLVSRFECYEFGISVGKKLDYTIVDGLVNGPTIEYFRHYNQINADLEEVTLRIARDLNNNGFHALATKPTISAGSEGYEEYLERLTYDISHKMVGTRAGLGWIGKSDLFISEKFGPRLRLDTILLKEDPEVRAVPVERSKCGKCRMCVTACPANAANGRLWDIYTQRDEFFDAFRCREKCGELARNRLNVDERICGLCISVCPVGKKSYL